MIQETASLTPMLNPAFAELFMHVDLCLLLLTELILRMAMRRAARTQTKTFADWPVMMRQPKFERQR